MSSQPTPARLLPIEALNRLPEPAFVAALRPLFEFADLLARRLYQQRPHLSYEALLDGAARSVAGLSEREQIELLNAHPRIGMPADGLLRLSEISYREQGYDRDLAADRAELERLAQRLESLNRAYEETFGFRFVVFVNRRPRCEIAGLMQQRLGNSRAVELETALVDMLAIARDRLRTLSA